MASGLMVRTLEILWHCAEKDDEAEWRGIRSTIEGISSIDYCPHTNRIVTTGGDGSVRIWQLLPKTLVDWLKDGTVDMTAPCKYVSTMRAAWMPLTARWSPHGTMIASGHCEGKICIWWKDCSVPDVVSSPTTNTSTGGGGGSTAFNNNNGSSSAAENKEDPNVVEEVWKDYRHLHGHHNDVYDIAFSPDSRFLLSGSSDGCITIHEIDGPPIPLVQITDAHSKFCHGVAWDPWNHYVASFGGGPPLSFYTPVPKTRQQPMHLASKRNAQGAFIGESCMLCFRRAGWSPDGSLFAAPFGKVNDAAAKEDDMTHCVYLYTRNRQDKPAARLVVRGHNEIRGVLWAPCFFKPNRPAPNVNVDASKDKGETEKMNQESNAAQDAANHAWGPQDYRMALAVWTSDSVLVYTTDCGARHSDFTDLHMRAITDLAWSMDARFLLTASYDGYVSVIHFGDTLGESFRLPTFSTSPVTQTICGLKLSHWLTGRELENKKRQQQQLQAASSRTTVVQSVRKKAKVEKKKTTDGSSLEISSSSNSGGGGVQAPQMESIGAAELAALLDS